jgi:hypothetical protein
MLSWPLRPQTCLNPAIALMILQAADGSGDGDPGSFRRLARSASMRSDEFASEPVISLCRRLTRCINPPAPHTRAPKLTLRPYSLSNTTNAERAGTTTCEPHGRSSGASGLAQLNELGRGKLRIASWVSCRSSLISTTARSFC